MDICWVLESYGTISPSQYLQVVAEEEYQPYIVRSDRGKETELAAEVHYAFARTMQNDLNFSMGNCWFYGTSTVEETFDGGRRESWLVIFSTRRICALPFPEIEAKRLKTKFWISASSLQQIQ
jgi:hypothetical protein